MRPRTLVLTKTERLELEHMRDHDPRPYLRERAAALLKVASGVSALQVARVGLLKERHQETVRLWLNDYEQTRTLRPQPARRGAFPPSAPAPAKRRGARAPAPKP